MATIYYRGDRWKSLSPHLGKRVEMLRIYHNTKVLVLIDGQLVLTMMKCLWT
ncbi:hypothetical protein LCGC14_1128660 [marine sediment metagenome]|uniref:Uncharacterized protein n=1 Tax=marine sediment metagenome TaxID=412755 RepID=A0A0F9M1X1_9ZZZZ